MTTVLDSRQVRIARCLLESPGPCSTARLAERVGMSERVVRYRLGGVERFFAEEGISTTKRRGVGIVIEASEAKRARLLASLEETGETIRAYVPEERVWIALTKLLWTAPAHLSIEVLAEELHVSTPSARRDVQLCETWLARHQIPLSRRPGRGVVALASERRLRQVMVQVLLEAVPGEVLDRLMNRGDRGDARVSTPIGLRDRLQSIPLAQAAEAVAVGSVSGIDERSDNARTMAIFMACSIARMQHGHHVEVERGFERLIAGHPVADSLEPMTEAIEEIVGVELSKSERASLIQYAIGLGAVESVGDGQRSRLSRLVEAIMEEASQSLHPALREDHELRRGLAGHLGRLAVRLKHGLPVHNPLLDDVASRFPDVYRIGQKIAGVIEEATGAEVLDAEVGFITMYLAGALERARLRPRARGVVVCPSGMATVWVLVSRLQAEFPGLELVHAVSMEEFQQLNVCEFDIVVSTVPLQVDDVPLVVVNPLLIDRDVASIRQHI